MAQTLYQSASKSENKLLQGIALSIATTDELGAALPFQNFQGQALVYNREGDPPSTEFVADNSPTVSESSAGTDLVAVPVRRIASDIDVDSLADDLSEGRDMGTQIAAKTKKTWDLVLNRVAVGGNVTSHTLGSSANPFAAIDGMVYGPWLDSQRDGPGEIKYTHTGTAWAFRAPGDATFGAAVTASADGLYVLKSANPSKWIAVTLDVSDATADGRTWIEFASNNNEFDGLPRLCSRSQVRASVAADGDVFSFDILDELIDMVKVRDNRAIVCNARMKRRILATYRTLSMTPDHAKLPGYNGQVLTYRGLPILTNDHIPSTESKGGSSGILSSIYCASLGAEEGLFLGVPSNSERFDVNADPRRTVVMGFRIEEIGALETKAARRTRVQWYGALGLRSSLALARASELKLTAT